MEVDKISKLLKSNNPLAHSEDTDEGNYSTTTGGYASADSNYT